MKIETKPKKLDLANQILKFHPSDVKNTKSYISLFVLVFAGLFFLQDIYVDIVIEGKPLSHLLLESGVFISILVALLYEISRVLRLTSKVNASQKQIAQFKAHLFQVISSEFELWGLTDTEKEIALMLIKGMSMQEIADVRSVKEKSVRQRATCIYSKANVTNRYELTSYFIEDLLAPDIT